MKRGLEFIANRQNTINRGESALPISDRAQGIISRMKIDYCQTTFIGSGEVLLWAVKNPDRDFRQSGFPVL